MSNLKFSLTSNTFCAERVYRYNWPIQTARSVYYCIVAEAQKGDGLMDPHFLVSQSPFSVHSSERLLVCCRRWGGERGTFCVYLFVVSALVNSSSLCLSGFIFTVSFCH